MMVRCDDVDGEGPNFVSGALGGLSTPESL